MALQAPPKTSNAIFLSFQSHFVNIVNHLNDIFFTNYLYAGFEKLYSLDISFE